MGKDLNGRPETIKLLEENAGSKLLNIGLGVILSKGNKGKYKHVGLHQSKKLLHRKGNHQQNKKATYQMKESICK